MVHGARCMLHVVACCATLQADYDSADERSKKMLHSLTSKVTGTIAAGTKLRVLESRICATDGTHRVLVAAAEAEHSVLPIGWVTAQAPPVPATRPAEWSSVPMELPLSAFPPAVYLSGLLSWLGTAFSGAPQTPRQDQSNMEV